MTQTVNAVAPQVVELEPRRAAAVRIAAPAAQLPTLLPKAFEETSRARTIPGCRSPRSSSRSADAALCAVQANGTSFGRLLGFARVAE